LLNGLACASNRIDCFAQQLGTVLLRELLFRPGAVFFRALFTDFLVRFVNSRGLT
jgi:hypothetical protein